MGHCCQPFQAMDLNTMMGIMFACIILHNMVIEDELGHDVRYLRD